MSLKRTDVKHPLPLVTLGLRWRNASRPMIRASIQIKTVLKKEGTLSFTMRACGRACHRLPGGVREPTILI
jgi:hypothetical protein